MNVLLLSKKFPFPVKDGESLAIMNLSKGLHANGCKVSLLAMNTTKHFFDGNDLPTEMDFFESVQTVKVDNRVKPLGAFLNLFSKSSYNIDRFISSEYKRVLSELLQSQSFDIIQLETLYLGPYIPLIRSLTKVPIVMRAHNMEFEIWDRIAKTTRPGPKKWYIQYLTNKLKRYEIEQLAAYDLLAAITLRDQENFRQLGHRGAAISLPIGLDTQHYQPDYSSFENPLSLSFIGSLDWMPNLTGLQWFISEVWTPYKNNFPEVSLHVAGRNTPQDLLQHSNGQLVIHGEVPDAQIFINGHAVMVVPLHSGSGMRAKILEAMALGRVVLSTTLGLEGIDAIPGKEVLVADTPKAFVQQIKFCQDNPDELRRIGEAARQKILKQYDNLAIAKKLKMAYQELL